MFNINEYNLYNATSIRPSRVTKLRRMRSWICGTSENEDDIQNVICKI